MQELMAPIAPRTNGTANAKLKPIVRTLTQTAPFGLNSLLIPDRDKEADLKIEFLACLERCQAQRHALRGVIQRAFRLGHTRADLIEWGVSANYSRPCMRKIISLALLQAGLRSRKRGAGPKPPREALEPLAFAENSYGENAGKFLRAACRALRSRSHIALSPESLKSLNNSSTP